MKLRNKLFLSFLICGTALTAGGVFYQYTRSVVFIKDELYGHLKTAVSERSQLVELYLSERKADAGALLTNPNIVAGVKTKNEMVNIPNFAFSEETDNFLQSFLKRYSYREVFFAGEAGDVFWTSGKSDKLNSNYLTNQPVSSAELGAAFAEAKIKKSAVISGLDISKSAQDASFYLVAPFLENEKIIGYAGLQISGDNIFEVILENDRIKETAKIYLVNKDSILISPIYAKEGKIINQKISSYAVEQCFSPETGVVAVADYPDFRGTMVIGSYYSIKEYDWCLIAEVDGSEALSPGTQLLVIGLSIGAVITLAILILGLLLSRTIARPLELLINEVEKVKGGNLNFKRNLKTTDEIGALELSFENMVERIKKSHIDTENKVQSQTEEIVKQKNILESQQRAVLNILEDIQDEKEKLSQEKDKINTILLSIGDGVFVVDQNREIIIFNQVAEEISGFSREEVLGKKYSKILQFVFEKTGKPNCEFVDAAFEFGSVQTMKNHTILIRKDGSRIPVADSAAPLKDSNGKIIGCVVVFRDVTKEREIDTMKSEFISVASHQLKTPLTGIRWFAEFLLKGDAGKLNKDQLEFVKQIFDSNERMIILVNDLLNVSRIETGKKFAIEKTPVNLSDLIGEVVKENIDLATKKNIVIEQRIKDTKKLVLNIDAQKIRQVFHNLISNAIKYSLDGGKVQVGCLSDNAKEYVFYVKDNGLGIPKKQQKRVFEKFFRADNAISTQTDGTGLGLYIARAIIEAHGGKIWFESVEGKGSTFYFALPAEPKINDMKNSKIKVAKKSGGG